MAKKEALKQQIHEAFQKKECSPCFLIKSNTVKQN